MKFSSVRFFGAVNKVAQWHVHGSAISSSLCTLQWLISTIRAIFMIHKPTNRFSRCKGQSRCTWSRNQMADSSNFPSEISEGRRTPFWRIPWLCYGYFSRINNGNLDWVANKRFEISKFKFKFPRARTYEIIGLVLGCIDAKFCKSIFVGKLLTRSTRCTYVAPLRCQNFSKTVLISLVKLNSKNENSIHAPRAARGF